VIRGIAYGTVGWRFEPVRVHASERGIYDVRRAVLFVVGRYSVSILAANPNFFEIFVIQRRQLVRVHFLRVLLASLSDAFLAIVDESRTDRCTIIRCATETSYKLTLLPLC
jgi:hypothetical protein